MGRREGIMGERRGRVKLRNLYKGHMEKDCLLYTSDAADDPEIV